MTQNLLVLCDSGLAVRIAALAARSGSTLGLVNTCLDPGQLKPSGGRIEEQRLWGDVAFHAFDEPLCVGSAIAQLAGYADAVVVNRLDDWAQRMCDFWRDSDERIASELTSVTSVLSAHLADVVLVSASPRLGDERAAALHRRMLDEFLPHCSRLDLRVGRAA